MLEELKKLKQEYADLRVERTDLEDQWKKLNNRISIINDKRFKLRDIIKAIESFYKTEA